MFYVIPVTNTNPQVGPINNGKQAISVYDRQLGNNRTIISTPDEVDCFIHDRQEVLKDANKRATIDALGVTALGAGIGAGISCLTEGISAKNLQKLVDKIYAGEKIHLPYGIILDPASDADLANAALQKMDEIIKQGRDEFAEKIKVTTDTLSSVTDVLKETPRLIEESNKELQNTINLISDTTKEQINFIVSEIKTSLSAELSKVTESFDDSANKFKNVNLKPIMKEASIIGACIGTCIGLILGAGVAANKIERADKKITNEFIEKNKFISAQDAE